MEQLWSGGLTLGKIAAHYRGRVAITWILLLGESLLILLFPLAIGISVDSLINDSYEGVYFLASLCVLVMVFGAGRRFYDTRAYAVIFRELAASMVGRHATAGESTSAQSARVALLHEIVDFFENTVPELLGGVVAFVGVLIILGTIDAAIAGLCLVVSVLVIIVYWFSERRIFRYNAAENDELERRVTVLESGEPQALEHHLKQMVHWRIRLSDLETLNFSAVWMLLATLIVASTVLVNSNADISYGKKVTSIMYVFQYLEVVMGFPLIFQQVIRLREITRRLSQQA